MLLFELASTTLWPFQLLSAVGQPATEPEPLPRYVWDKEALVKRDDVDAVLGLQEKEQFERE